MIQTDIIIMRRRRKGKAEDFNFAFPYFTFFLLFLVLFFFSVYGSQYCIPSLLSLHNIASFVASSLRASQNISGLFSCCSHSPSRVLFYFIFSVLSFSCAAFSSVLIWSLSCTLYSCCHSPHSHLLPFLSLF